MPPERSVWESRRWPKSSMARRWPRRSSARSSSGRRSWSRPGTAAGTGGGHRRRGSGEPGLRRGQVARRPRSAAFTPSQHTLPAETTEAALLALIDELNADPDDQRHPGAAAAADAHRFRPGHPDNRAGKGRRRLPLRQCRQARHRRTGYRLRALHAGRLDAADRAGARQGPVGPQCGRRRPLQHRRQADGQSAAGRQCTVTIAHSRTRDLAGAGAHGRYPGRRRRPAAKWSRATGSSRARR